MLLPLLLSCLAEVDPCAKQVFFIDADGDGVGGERMAIRCQGIEGLVSVSGDCDDTDASVTEAVVRFEDADGDGWGDQLLEICGSVEGTVEVNGDCDDADPTVHPNAEELCDGLDNDCDGAPSEARVPQDHATIQEALDAGESWICLDEGVFTEDLALPPWALTLEGQGLGLSVIEGSGEGPVVQAVGSEARLEGLSVRGGEAELGAGLYASQSRLELVEVELSEHRCASTESCVGTAFWFEDSQVRLEGVSIHGNEAVAAQNVYGVGGSTDWSQLELVDVSIDDNHSSAGEQSLGVALWTKGEIAMTRVSMRGNSVRSGNSFGSVWFHRSALARAENLAILGNGVPGESDFGCGVVCLWNASLSLDNSALVGNEVSAGEGCAGLVLANDSASEIWNTDISLNGAAGQGSGLVCGDSGGGDLSVGYSNLLPPGEEVFPGLDGVSLDEGVLSELPGYASVEAKDPRDWDLGLVEGSALIDAGDPELLDVDGSRSDIGVLGGPAAE